MKKAPVRKGHHYYHTDTIIGNIFIVSLVFGVAFYISDIPLYSAFILVGLHLRLLRSVLNFMLIAVKKWKGFIDRENKKYLIKGVNIWNIMLENLI